MKLFIASLRLEGKRLLCSRWFITLLLVLLIVLTGLVGYSKRETSGIEFRVGLVFEEDDSFAKAVFSRLQLLDLATFDSLRSLSQTELEQAIASRSYEAIYFLEPSLQRTIASGLFSDSIPSIVSEHASASKIIDEWLFGAVIAESSPDIAIEEIDRILGISPQVSAEEIKNKIQWYQDNNTYVEAVANWEGNSPETSDNARLGWARIVHGILAVILFLFFAASLSSLHSRLHHVDSGVSHSKRPIYRLASLLSHIINGFLLGAIGLGLLWLTDKRLLSTFWLEIISLFAYLLFLSGLTIFLATVLPNIEGIFSGVIFALLCTLALGGTLYAPKEIGTWLDGIAHGFPTYYYLDSVVTRRYLPLLPLLIMGLALFFGSLFIPLISRKNE